MLILVSVNGYVDNVIGFRQITPGLSGSPLRYQKHTSLDSFRSKSMMQMVQMEFFTCFHEMSFPSNDTIASATAVSKEEEILPFSVMYIMGLLYRSLIQPRILRIPLGTTKSQSDGVCQNATFCEKLRFGISTLKTWSFGSSSAAH